MRVIVCHHFILADQRVFDCGAGTRTNAAGRHHDVRADSGEDRAERCNRVYYADGVARAATVHVLG